MRARLLVIGALLALVGAPPAHARGCARSLPHGPRVPARIAIRTICGLFELRPDGSVVYGRAPAWAPPWAPHAVSHPDPRTWVAHPHKRLAVYRDRRLLWHSHVTGGTDDVAIGHGHVAFTVFRHYGMSLWVAPLRGIERRVARTDEIVGWIPAGLLTQRRARLSLRAADGHVLRSLGRARSAFVDDGLAVILRTDGVIVRTDGWHSRTLVDLRRYRMTEYPWLQRLDDGLWQVQSRNRVLFLDRDGRRFAAATAADIAGSVIPVPDRSAVLFVVRRRRTAADPGVMLVERLERGGRRPRRLYSARVRQLSCGEWGGLDYERGRVLFTSSEAGYAILDPAGRARPIDLTAFMRRLLPQRSNPPQPSYVGWAR